MNDFDTALLSGSEFLMKGKRAVLSRIGRLIAVLTFIAVGIVTFTDVFFSDVTRAQTLLDLTLYLIGASTVFFSLEKDGETSATEDREYSSALSKFKALSEKITGEVLGDLRNFLDQYSKAEYAHRLSTAMTRLGVSNAEYEKFQRGEKLPKATRRACRNLRNVKPYPLSAGELLTECDGGGKSELVNPGSFKGGLLLSKLVPSLICMSFTVAIVIKVKDGLTADVLIGGIFRLCALLTVGAKGYLFGFRYIAEDKCKWLGTKAKLLESFLNRRG